VIPFNDLIKLKKKGYVSYLRESLIINLNRFNNAPIDNLDEITRLVDLNLERALTKHHREIKQLNKQMKLDLSISASTLLANAIVKLQLISLPFDISFLGPIVGTVSLSYLVRKTVDYLTNKKKLAGSSLGILWKAKS